MHEVRVDHGHHRDALGQRPPDGEDLVRRRPGAQRGRPRGVDDRAVGQRVAEREAELDEVGAAVGVGLARRAATSSMSGKPPIM